MQDKKPAEILEEIRKDIKVIRSLVTLWVFGSIIVAVASFFLGRIASSSVQYDIDSLQQYEQLRER